MPPQFPIFCFMKLLFSGYTQKSIEILIDKIQNEMAGFIDNSSERTYFLSTEAYIEKNLTGILKLDQNKKYIHKRNQDYLKDLNIFYSECETPVLILKLQSLEYSMYKYTYDMNCKISINDIYLYGENGVEILQIQHTQIGRAHV